MQEKKNQKSRKGDKRGGKRREEKELDHSLLHVARVARVVQGGRRFSFRATVAVGDHKGKVGVGVAKGPDVSVAIGKAIHDAQKGMIKFPILNNTIPHEVTAKYGSAKVILKPATASKGIVAGGAIRIIAELGGIKNLTAKCLGSNNRINTARSMLEALKKLKTTAVPVQKQEKQEKEKKTEKGEEEGKGKEKELGKKTRKK